MLDFDDLGDDPLRFLLELRSIFPELRTVVLTSSPEIAGKVKLAGATVVLLKPVSPQVIAAVIRGLLNASQQAARGAAQGSSQSSKKTAPLGLKLPLEEVP